MWASWAFAAWFFVALALINFRPPLSQLLPLVPSWPLLTIDVVILFRGGIVFFGGMLAAAYLLLGIFLPVRWLLGAGALVTNAVFLWMYLYPTPKSTVVQFVV